MYVLYNKRFSNYELLQTISVQSETVSSEDKEYDGSRKRQKTSHTENEDIDKSEESTENRTEDSNVQKKTDGEEIYDPLEADVESEDDECREQGNAKKATEIIASDKDILVDEMWAEIDNEIEMCNLIDDDEKECIDLEKPTQKIDQTQNPQTKSPRGRGTSQRSRSGPRARRSRR